MAKPNIQDILLKKGDKIALGVGAALVGGLTLWGVANFATADSPASLVKQFDGKATALKSQVAAEGTDAPELPAWVMKGADKVAIDTAQFALAGAPFETVDKPDSLRNNPRVLLIDNAQFDFVRFPMRAWDIRTQEDGSTLVGFKVATAKGVTDTTQLTANLKGLGDRQKIKAAPLLRLQPTGAPRPLPPAPGAPGGLPPGYPGAAGAPPGGSTGMPGESAGLVGSARDDQTVAFYTPADGVKKGLQQAETVYPLKMLVVTATFPVKKQIEELRQALRARTNEEAVALSGVLGVSGPVFAGFEVDRRMRVAGSEWSGWTPYDHKAEYLSKIYSRAIETVPEVNLLSYFVPPADQEMVYPLPAFADGLGEYRKITMPAIVKQMAELTKLNAPKLTESELSLRVNGKGGANSSPFVPLSTAAAGAAGQPGSMAPGMARPGFPNSTPGGPGSAGQVGPGGTAGVLLNQPNPYDEIIEHNLLRFLDTDIQPGVSYQYRVKVKMRNPNFGKTSLVSRPDDAKREILEGPWLEIPEVFTAPSDYFLYAHDSAEYAEASMKLVEANGKETPFRKFLEVDEVRDGRRAVVEIQRWMPGVRLDNTKVEPVGTWVVGKMPVGPGEFIGKRQFLELPLWSGGLGNYVLRELAGGLRIAGIKDPKHQPKGWPMGFRSASILIDFDGGKVKPRINDRDVADDADSELLILQPDGKLLVRNSGADTINRERKERDTVWSEWIARVRQRNDVAVPGSGAQSTPGPGGFSKPGSN